MPRAGRARKIGSSSRQQEGFDRCQFAGADSLEDRVAERGGASAASPSSSVLGARLAAMEAMRAEVGSSQAAIRETEERLCGQVPLALGAVVEPPGAC